MSEYRARLVKAITALSDLAGSYHGIDNDERDRLNHKMEGVKLALSYYDEMENDNGK